MTQDYQPEPPRDEIESLRGPSVIEFGNSWCGYCQAAEPLVAAAFADFPSVRHIKVADGSGRPLGRSFRVKLWPTLVFLRDGREVGRVIRPSTAEEVRRNLERATSSAD